MPLPRKLTLDEEKKLLGDHPRLDTKNVDVTAERTWDYNCIAWTLGITNAYPWPPGGTSLDAFDDWYSLSGYVRADNGPIAVYGVSDSELSHGAVSGPAHGSRWESKLGHCLRIQHGLPELEGGHYGHVIAFYRESLETDTSERMRHYLEQLRKAKKMKTYLTPEQRLKLDREIGEIPEAVRNGYQVAFGKWKESWCRGSLRTNSNPSSRRYGLEFDALVAMGSKILPMIVSHLAEPPNFFALQLYDTLQTNPLLRVQYGSRDERALEGEQGRARRTVQAWFGNR